MLDNENSAGLPEPDCGRTEVSVQHHLSVRIGEQDGCSSLAADGAQLTHHDALLLAQVSSPEPATLGDRHLRSSASSHMHLSLQGTNEAKQGSRHAGQPPPHVVVTNEPATRLAEDLHTARPPVPATSRADCRKLESGSSVVEIKEARDFAQKLSHKHETIRPGMPGEWSFEARQVPAPGVAAAAVTIDWTYENSEVAEPQLDHAATAQRRDSHNVAAEDEYNRGNNTSEQDTREGETARDMPAIPAKAVMSKISMPAFNATVPVAEAQADVTTRQLPVYSGASVASEEPARVTASGGKTEDGREEFKVHVSSSRSGGSIHLEGLILNNQSAKDDAVHSFNITAVRNVHGVYNSAQSQEGDTEYLLQQVTSIGSPDKAVGAAKTKYPEDPQVEEFVAAQKKLDAKTTSESNPLAAEIETAQTKHPVVHNEIGDTKDGAQLPLQNLGEHVPRTGSKGFRATAVPATNVPSIGSVTEVAIAVPSDLCKLGPSQVGGPFVPSLEYEASTTLSLRSSDGVDELDIELVAAERSSKTASRVSSSRQINRTSRSRARPALMEEFLFPSTTVGLTHTERLALPPVRGNEMSLSRLHLPFSDQISEFGFAATTFGMAEEDRCEIAPNQIFLERPGISRSEISNSSTSSRTRCSTSRLEIVDSSAWDISGRNVQYPPDTKNNFRKTKYQRGQERAEEHVEFGFSATTLGFGNTVQQAVSQSNREVEQTTSRSLDRQVPTPLSNSSLRAKINAGRTGDVGILVRGSSRNIAEKFKTDSSRETMHTQESFQCSKMGSVVPRHVRFVNVESTITGESSLDLPSEQPMSQRYSSQEFSVTSSKATLGPDASFGKFTAKTVDKVNPNMYRTPCREQLNGDLLIVPPLPTGHHSIEDSFHGPESMLHSLQFVDAGTGFPRRETDSAQMTPSVRSSHMNFEHVESTFSSLESSTDFATAQETAHSSFGVGLEAFSMSSSSSVAAGGVGANQALQFFTHQEAPMVFPNAVNSYEPLKGVATAELSDPLSPAYCGTPMQWPVASESNVEAPLAINGQHRHERYFSSSFLPNHPVGFMPNWPAVVSPRESIGKVFNPSFDQTPLEQGGDQESVPYRRYRVPSEYTENNFPATHKGDFQTSFSSPTPPVHVRGALQSQMNTVVATATGEFPEPRAMLPQHGFPRTGRASLSEQPRLVTSGRIRRGDRKQSSQGQDEWAAPRASVSSQLSARMGANFGLNPRRSQTPNRRVMQPWQQGAMQPTYARAQYWDNSPYGRSSWHGGRHEDENLVMRPPVFARPTRSPYSEASAEQAIQGNSWISKRKIVFRAERFSTFESHENGDEPLATTGKVSAAFLKRTPWPERKATSAKTVVQTESRITSTSCSSVNDGEGVKIITPRVKTHVDIGVSNTALTNSQYTPAATQTEPYQLAWNTTKSLDQPTLKDPLQFPPYSGATPCPGYINQNFVCSPYPLYFDSGPHIPATVPIFPTAEAQLVPPVAPVGYIAPPQIQNPSHVKQPGAVPAPSASSSEHAGTCPLSSCLRSVCGGDEYHSEGRPRKHSSCDHRYGKRGRSPLPPPALGSTFTVGYVMNSENELNPVLMPLDADTAPKAPSVARSVRAPTVDTCSRGAASVSETEEDRIAKFERRVQRQMKEIEKSIKEYDARRKEEELEIEKSKDKESKKKERDGHKRRRRKRKNKYGKKLRKIQIAKAYESLSSSDSDAENAGWFSWSSRSKSPRGDKLRIPSEQVETQTGDHSRSYCRSKENFPEHNDKVAISGVSKREGSTDAATFAWATRRKTSKKRCTRWSPRGCIANKGDCKREREGPPLQLTLKKYGASPEESSKQSTTLGPQRSPRRRRVSGAARSEQHKTGSSPGRFSPSPVHPQSYQSDAASDTELLAKVQVAFPRDRKTQRRWSRTEMHRSTSYGTAPSSAAPSSTKERRIRSEQQLLVRGFPEDENRLSESEGNATPSSWWSSMCSLFKGADERRSPSPKRAKSRRKSGKNSVCESCRCRESKKPKLASSHRPPSRRRRSVEPGVAPLHPSLEDPPPFMPYEPFSSARFARRESREDVKEQDDAVEKKPAPKGSMLSSILSWFSSRSSEKQDKARRGSKGRRDESSSSFQSWITQKRRALKEAQAKLNADKNAGGPGLPRELYFQEGGRRWVIRCSPSPSATEWHSPRHEPATTGVLVPPMPSGPSPYGAPLGIVRCTFGGSGENAVFSRQPPGHAPSAEKNSSVQYICGGPRMEASGPRSSGKKPMASVGDSYKDSGAHHGLAWAANSGISPATSTGPGVTPLGAFRDEPDWILRISRGRKQRSSSRSAERSAKKNELYFKENEKFSGSTKPEPQVAPPKPVRDQESEPPPQVALPTQPSLAPPPIQPRVLKTEESFMHEFYEEVDERGMSALTARSDKRRSSLHEATALAATNRAHADSLLNARGNEGRKTSAIIGELDGPSATPQSRNLGGVFQPEKRSGSIAESLQLSLSTARRPRDTGIKHLEPPDCKAKSPTPENKAGEKAECEEVDKFSGKGSPKAASEAKTGKKDWKASGQQDKAAISGQDKAAISGPLATGDPAHTNYVLQQKMARKVDGRDPLSYKCPTMQEVVGYAIVTTVVLLGLVLLVSVPRMRSHALNLQE